MNRILHSDRLWLAIGMVVLALGVFALVRDSQVQACQRGAADRWDNAQAWRQAYTARQEAFEKTGDPITGRAAEQYLHTARSLESRTAPTAPARGQLCDELLPRWPWQ